MRKTSFAIVALALLANLPQARADGPTPPVVMLPPPIVILPRPVAPPPPPPRRIEPEDFCGINGEIQGPINRNLIAQATDHFIRDEILVPGIRFLRDQYNQVRAGTEEGNNILTRMLDDRIGDQVTVFTQTVAQVQLMNGTLLTLGRVVPDGRGTPQIRPLEFQVVPEGEVLRRPPNYPPNMRICSYMLVLPVSNDLDSRQLIFFEANSPRPPLYAPGVLMQSKRIRILRNGN